RVGPQPRRRRPPPRHMGQDVPHTQRPGDDSPVDSVVGGVEAGHRLVNTSDTRAIITVVIIRATIPYTTALTGPNSARVTVVALIVRISDRSTLVRSSIRTI